MVPTPRYRSFKKPPVLTGLWPTAWTGASRHEYFPLLSLHLLPTHTILKFLFYILFPWSHLFVRRCSYLHLLDTLIPHEMVNPIPSQTFCESLNWGGGKTGWGGHTVFLPMAIPDSAFLFSLNSGSHSSPCSLPSPKQTQIQNSAL